MLKKLQGLFLIAILLCIVLYIGFFFGRSNSDSDFFFKSKSRDEIISESQGFQKIDLNTATEEDLCDIPGVTRHIAKEIIEYRETYGPYYHVKELKYFDSISNDLYETMLNYIVVEE